MTALKLAFLICAYGSTILVRLSEGVAIDASGPCPEGHKPGDTFWEGSNHCGGCTCNEQGWICLTCNGYVDLPFGCYEDTNPHATYPHCCPRSVCKGDPDFDQTRVHPFGK